MSLNVSSRKRGLKDVTSAYPQVEVSIKCDMTVGCPHDPSGCIFSCQGVLERSHCGSGSQCDCSCLSLNQLLVYVAGEIQPDVSDKQTDIFILPLFSCFLSFISSLGFFFFKYQVFALVCALSPGECAWDVGLTTDSETPFSNNKNSHSCVLPLEGM